MSTSALWLLSWTSAFLLISFLSHFIYLSFASLTPTYILSSIFFSLELLCKLYPRNNWSLFNITVSTQLPGRNWCCSSPVEAGKKPIKLRPVWSDSIRTLLMITGFYRNYLNLHLRSVPTCWQFAYLQKGFLWSFYWPPLKYPLTC